MHAQKLGTPWKFYVPAHALSAFEPQFVWVRSKFNTRTNYSKNDFMFFYSETYFVAVVFLQIFVIILYTYSLLEAYFP